MKRISGESFEVKLGENNTVQFKGALRLSGSDDYGPILGMLTSALGDQGKPVVVDVRELDFLNSSGITMLSRFVIEARNRSDVNLDFFASEAVPWQARSLKNLQRLMPTLNIHLT
jgi:hypothetical protein